MNRLNSSTSSFREIAVFIGKMLLLLAGIIIFFYRIEPQYNGSYNSSMIDKAERIDAISEAKIVLIGHSGLSFGIDSEMMQEALGMPVVNMGLHGGLGNAFHEEMAKMNVCPGDIYIVCHSSFSDNDTMGDPVLTWTTIENYPRLWKLIRPQDILKMYDAYPTYLKRSLNLYTAQSGNTDSGGVYSRSAFNEYGDVALERLGHTYKFEKVEVPVINDITVPRLNELNTWLNERGATLLVAGYNIGNGHLTADVDDFMQFQEELTERLDCPVISNYVDYMFAYNLFYDTNLHLSTEGTRIRTQQLISDISRWRERGTDADMDDDDYEEVLFDCTLAHITEFEEYIETLMTAKDRYIVFISAKDEPISGLDEKDYSVLRTLGIEELTSDGSRASYYAVITPDSIAEQISNEKIEVTGETDGLSWSIVSAGFESGNDSSIMIRDQEFSYKQRGLNIVVYSITRDRIIDCVSFDTYLPEKPVFRQ